MRFVGCDQRGPVVGAYFRETESAGPGADGVFLAGEELQAGSFGLVSVVRSVVGVATEGGGGIVEVWETARDDVEQHLVRLLDAQRSFRANHRRAQIHEASRAAFGQPFLAFDGDEGLDQLLELGWRESGEGDAGGGVEHAGCVEGGTEEAEFEVVATVEFHAFEAGCCVVQDGSVWLYGERAVWDEGWGCPAGFGGPGCCDHMVRTAIRVSIESRMRANEETDFLFYETKREI